MTCWRYSTPISTERLPTKAPEFGPPAGPVVILGRLSRRDESLSGRERDAFSHATTEQEATATAERTGPPGGHAAAVDLTGRSVHPDGRGFQRHVPGMAPAVLGTARHLLPGPGGGRRRHDEPGLPGHHQPDGGCHRP